VPLDIPPELHMVESFAHSADAETGADDFDSTARFGRWLAAHGYPSAADPDADQLAFAVGFRAALWVELMAHHGGGDPAEAARARAELHRYAASVPLRAVFGDGPAGLAGVGDGFGKMMGDVVGEMVVAERDGTWRRLKICREDTCGAVYYDRSKNSSKTWCSMAICGNRNKTRSYRDRRREVPTPPPPPAPLRPSAPPRPPAH
jgi:predicted RNA-binding Zn ribbon-like protein